MNRDEITKKLNEQAQAETTATIAYLEISIKLYQELIDSHEARLQMFKNHLAAHQDHLNELKKMMGDEQLAKSQDALAKLGEEALLEEARVKWASIRDERREGAADEPTN